MCDEFRTSESAITYILLSTHNGARYLREQLDSVLSQSCKDWILLARDDGSSDGTVAVLQEYAAKDHRIRVLRGPAHNLGAVSSFGYLLDQGLRAGGEYFLFCDQDDVWHEEKVGQLVSALCSTESISGAPVIAHSDLEVVDSQLGLISPSFFRYMHFSALPNTDRGFRYLCVQNFFTGCAMAVNRAAAEMSLPFPKSVYMHDWWIGLTTGASGGRFVFIDSPLIKYRQHDANVEGGRGGFWGMMNPASAGFRKRLQNNERNFNRMRGQLVALSDWLKGQPENRAREFVEQVLAVFESPPYSFKRLSEIARAGLRRQDLFRSALLVARFWRAPSCVTSEVHR